MFRWPRRPGRRKQNGYGQALGFFFIHSQRWVWAFKRDSGLQINTNVGLESQARALRHDFLADKHDASVSAVLSCLLTEHLPAAMTE